MNVLVPLGTRPEIVKLAPVVRALREAGVAVRTVATGQHYDATLTSAFYDALGLQPDETWSLSGDEGERVGTILTLAHGEIAARRPDLVLLLGDTWTVPLFSLAARSHRVPVAHIEAGLRSFNETSMEEVNRRVAGAAASLHFAPTQLASKFLEAEGIDRRRIRVVGNPVVDALRAGGFEPTPVEEREGIVLTAHRATNVDDPKRLERLVRLVLGLAADPGGVTFPVHPRTRARLEAAGALARLDVPGVRLLPPVAYERMLRLVAGARVVVTDSGGLQEEAAYLGVPVVVLRQSTPRWEGVLAESAVLTGLDVELAVAAVERLWAPCEQARVAALPCPFGDGRTGERIAEILTNEETRPLLRLKEPSFVSATPSEAPVRAILLDLDDTLFPQENWLAGAWKAVRAAAAPYGLDADAFEATLVEICSEGSAAGGIIDRALERHGAAHVPPAPLVRAFREYRAPVLDPYPRAAAALAEVRECALVCLVTDGDVAIQRSKLEALGLADAFDAIVFSDDLGRRFRKPNRAPFDAALEAVGVDAEHAVLIGDCPWKDVAGASAVGIRTIRVRTGEYRDCADDCAPWRTAEGVIEALELVRPLLETARVSDAPECGRDFQNGEPAAPPRDPSGRRRFVFP